MNVLIIGGSDWLGYELAKSFADMAENMILLARNKKKLSQVKEKISAQTNARDIICDLGNMNDIRHAIMAISEDVKSIDLTLNVAGGSYVGGTFECEPDYYFQMVDAYIRGQTYLIKSLLPIYRASNGTLLVNFLADWSVRKAGMECGNAIYTMTKTAMATFTDCLTSEEHQHGFRAMNIYLGEISEADSIDKLERDKKGNADLLFMGDICSFVKFIINSESLHTTDVILLPKSPSYARCRIHTNSPLFDI